MQEWDNSASIEKRNTNEFSKKLKLKSHSSIERKNKTKYHHHGLTYKSVNQEFFKATPEVKTQDTDSIRGTSSAVRCEQALTEQGKYNIKTPSCEFSSHMFLLERGATAQFLCHLISISYIMLTTSFLFFDQRNINIMRIGNYSPRCLLARG